MAAIAPQVKQSGGLSGLVGQGMAGVKPAQTTYPLQPETLAYCRGGRRPSFAWFDHVNSLIYRMKQSGAWAVLLAGYLFCAESEALALSELKGSLARRAAKTGAPTFTPGQGYSSPFDGANYIDIPVSNADTGSGQSAKLFGGLLSATQGALNFGGGQGNIIGAPAASGGSAVCLDYDDTKPGFLMQQSLCRTGDGPLICARNGSSGPIIYPGSGGPSLVTGGTNFASLRTGTATGNVLTRYCAMLLFLSTATDAQVQIAAMVLATFLYDTGALP